MTKPVIIHTDGACKGNPGRGGWGAVLSYNDHKCELSGGEANTTNNRMEITAVIRALQQLKKPNCNVHIYTDSQYVMRGMNEWLPGWRKKNFRKSDGKPVLNIDLWQQLEHTAAQHQIKWHWVRGHTGDPGNERADSLAQQAAAQQ